MSKRARPTTSYLLQYDVRGASIMKTGASATLQLSVDSGGDGGAVRAADVYGVLEDGTAVSGHTLHHYLEKVRARARATARVRPSPLGNVPSLPLAL